MIYILAIMVGCAFILYAMIAAVPKSDYERHLDDEEQMKYLENYKKNKK